MTAESTMEFLHKNWAGIAVGLVTTFIGWSAGHFWTGAGSALDSYDRNQIVEQLKKDEAFQKTVADVFADQVSQEKAELEEIRAEIDNQLARAVDDHPLTALSKDLSSLGADVRDLGVETGRGFRLVRGTMTKGELEWPIAVNAYDSGIMNLEDHIEKLEETYPRDYVWIK